MTFNIVYTIIKWLAIFFLIVSIAKKSIKLFLGIIIGLLIFQIAFIFDGNAIQEKFNLQDDNKLIVFFNDLNEKRKNYGILDAEEVYDGMVNTIDSSKDYIIKNGEKIFINNFDSLAKEINDQMIKENIKNIDKTKLKNSIKSNFKDLNDDEIDILTNKIIEENKNQ